MSEPNESELMKLLSLKGKTVEGLAEAMGRKPRGIFYWMAGGRQPKLTIEEAQKMCSYLECSIHELPTDFSRVQLDEEIKKEA